MSLQYVTRKLKTQSLAGGADEDDDDKRIQAEDDDRVDSDEAEEEDDDDDVEVRNRQHILYFMYGNMTKIH